MPAIAGSTATAIRPAALATSLLTAEATPACSAGADDMAVAVSGATLIATPKPNTTTAGSTATTYPPGPEILVNSSKDAAITSGPTDICSRGPILAASAPDLDDSSSMMNVMGSSEVPASIGLEPLATASTVGTRNSSPPSAAYTTNVTAFAAENCRDLNTPRGSIGSDSRASTRMKSPSSTTPRTSGRATETDPQPSEGPAISP